MGTKSAKIGLSSLYYALVTSDTVSGITYDTPVAVAGAIEAKVTSETSETNEYSDNVLSDTAYGAIKVTLELSLRDLDLETQAALLGHSISGGVVTVDGDDVAPYVAIGFKALKANGKYRYIWLMKGKFAEPDEGAKTKGENVEFQAAALKGTFGGTEYNGNVMRKADEDASGYSSSVGSNWFTSPTGSADTTPPTVSCVPIDGATGISGSADIVLTFSEEMYINSLVVGESFILQKNDGTDIAGVGTWSVGNTVYTFNPTPSLSGSYNVIVTKAVKDLSGNKLAAVNTFNFTTS